MAAQLAEKGDIDPKRNGATYVSKDELLRENYWLREVIQTRLDGNDKALALLQVRADKVPSDTDLAIDAAKAFIGEKFGAVETKFQSVDSKFNAADKNVSTALAAAKELGAEQSRSSAAAISKSEEATKTTLAALGDRISSIDSVTLGKFEDIKQRVLVIETTKKSSEDTRGGIGVAIGIASAVATTVAVVVGLLISTLHPSTPEIIQVPVAAAPAIVAH